MQTLEAAIPPEFLQLMSQAFQEAQQYQPQQPADPAQLAAQVQQMSIDQRREQAGQNAQIKGQELAVKQQQQDRELAVKQQMQAQQDEKDLQVTLLKEDREDARTQAEIAARISMNDSDNETAKELVAVEVASGERTSLSTGTGINPNP
jgi:hypothetical protein